MRKTISTKVMPGNDKAPMLEKKCKVYFDIDSVFSEQRIEGNRQNCEFKDYRASDYENESSVEEDDEDVFFH
jgi:hypothetical protein